MVSKVGGTKIVLARTIEGPKVPSEARSAEGGCGLGRGAVAPPQYGGLGALPPENFAKMVMEMWYFCGFYSVKRSLCASYAIAVT